MSNVPYKLFDLGDTSLFLTTAIHAVYTGKSRLNEYLAPLGPFVKPLLTDGECGRILLGVVDPDPRVAYKEGFKKRPGGPTVYWSPDPRTRTGASPARALMDQVSSQLLYSEYMLLRNYNLWHTRAWMRTGHYYRERPVVYTVTPLTKPNDSRWFALVPVDETFEMSCVLGAEEVDITLLADLSETQTVKIWKC